jgi:hypothetical protein
LDVGVGVGVGVGVVRRTALPGAEACGAAISGSRSITKTILPADVFIAFLLLLILFNP